MKPTKIRLFVKSYCPWCQKAMHWLNSRGIAYDSLDVVQDGKAMREMITLSGQTLAPVIEVDGQVLADFGPDQLERWWKKQGFDLDE